MQEALNAFYIRGVSHNINFLQALLAHPRFQEGSISTSLIAEEYPDGFHPTDTVRENPDLMIAAAAVIHRRYMERAARITGQLPGHERQVAADWVVLVNGEKHPVRVLPAESGSTVCYAGRHYQIAEEWQLGQPLFRAAINGVPTCMQVERPGLFYRLSHNGARADLLVLTPRAAELNDYMLAKQAPDQSRFLLSPMPGLLVTIKVAAGDEVKAGEQLAVIEAMKMENTLLAERDVIVKKILVKEGDSLAVDQAIIEFQ